MKLQQLAFCAGVESSEHIIKPQFEINPLNDPHSIEYVFDRPKEPIFMPKGPNEDVVFKVPVDYLSTYYQDIADYIEGRYNTLNATEITIPKVTTPDLSFVMQLGRREHFSHFIPFHRQMAGRLTKFFLDASTYEEFLSLAVYCRPRINPYMYVYALSLAIVHRPDTRNVRLPLHACLFPEMYFNGEIFGRLREEVTVVRPENRRPIEIRPDFTANDLEPEHRLAYFREDIGINMNHWHWHLAYPFDGPLEIVNKDRRGELFYYFHEQIMARYNAERFSNKLSRAKRLINWDEHIKEGYFPKLDSLIASRVWPPRQAHSVLHDINREEQRIVFDIQDLERWRDRLYQAIHTGWVRNEQGQSIALSPETGIDILGNLVEASLLSINPNFYGTLHNLGHMAIAYIHDPDNRHLEPFGVMGDTATAMRDPIFYRWHAFINDMFLEHKHTLPSYTIRELGFEGITITDLQVTTQGGQNNQLSTFWQQSDIDLARGLDFSPGGPVLVRVTHLQHVPFTYRIQVTNVGQPRIGTVRIFMAPKYDERGTPLLFQDQKSLFIELDKFQTTLLTGTNVIEQRSVDSSITTPYEYTFRDLSVEQPPTDGSQFNYFGCGWPQHMLIPKGSPEGLMFDLVVMISNYIDDRVEQRPSTNQCQDGHSYCGIRDQLYPDRRAMGFPFDRLPRRNVQTLSQFLTPNMRTANVTIIHNDITVPFRNP
ncbi:phenoloxidase 2 isoform X2 [Anabrus simplex]|uniref:phenoloxidase 2 isoform X2 n=1 Tax=Anabrus simplex TaxID=316456 RepID=UPI0035A2A0E5